MSLAEKLRGATRTEPGLPCGVGKVLQDVQGEDKEALELIFATRSRSGTISNRQIHDILLSEGFDVAFASVRLHRQQACRCFVGKNSPIRQQIQNGAS